MASGANAAARMTTAPWTTPEELVAQLRSRWNRGQYLRAHAQGEAWSPITGPKADDLLRDPAAVRAWCDRFRRASQARGNDERFAIEYRTVRRRAIGDIEVPARIRVETLEQLAALLGRSEDFVRLDRILDATRREVPEAVPWVAAHPSDALANHTIWNRLLTVVWWIRDNDTASSDLRQVDIPGVDTSLSNSTAECSGNALRVLCLQYDSISPRPTSLVGMASGLARGTSGSDCSLPSTHFLPK